MAHDGFAEWRALFERKVAKMRLLSGSAEELLETIEHAHDIRLKQAALLSLAAYQPESEQFRQALEKLMYDATLGPVALGLIASERLREFLPVVQRILLESEKHPPTMIEGALHVFIELNEDTDNLQPVLRRWANHSHTGIRLVAARGLVQLGDMDGLKIIEHALSSPVLNDRIAAQRELAFLRLPPKLRLSLLLTSLRRDFLLSNQQERWKFRRMTIDQIMLSKLVLKRQHERTLRVLSRRWKQDSETAYHAFIESLKDWHHQLIASGANDLAESVARLLSVISNDNSFSVH